MLSPDLTKRKLNPAWVSFDPENVSDDTLENIDPDSELASGVISIRFRAGEPAYRFAASYQFYQDFEASGFDTAFLSEYLDSKGGPGGWGWPYGRTKPGRSA